MPFYNKILLWSRPVLLMRWAPLFEESSKIYWIIKCYTSVAPSFRVHTVVSLPALTPTRDRLIMEQPLNLSLFIPNLRNSRGESRRYRRELLQWCHQWSRIPPLYADWVFLRKSTLLILGNTFTDYYNCRLVNILLT